MLMIIPRCGFILTFHSMQFGKNSLMSSFFLMIENICETGVAIVELFLIGLLLDLDSLESVWFS